MFARVRAQLWKWFLGRGLWCQIVELLPAIYDSFFIFFRGGRSGQIRIPPLLGLRPLLAFLTAGLLRPSSLRKPSWQHVEALMQMGCHRNHGNKDTTNKSNPLPSSTNNEDLPSSPASLWSCWVAVSLRYWETTRQWAAVATHLEAFIHKITQAELNHETMSVSFYHWR